MAPRSSLTVQIAMRIKEVESTNQHYMYDTVCQSLGTDFIHGHSHMTLVAYGPYNNGKSYTLIGDTDEESSKGILPRLVNDVMNRLVILSVKTRTQYLYYVSFIEIYNDIVIDLLSTRGGEAQTSFVLDIDELGYTHIQGVNKMACTSYDDVIHWLKLGLSRRNTKTIDSHVSSLSHVVFTFHVYSLQEGRLVKYNKLIFIDLTSNESENLIEESIHGYNEYYNSSYQIIYDVIANKYQFVVPNYFTAIHKYLQDAFNTNLVRPMKGKNQIDFVPNHMRTIVLCCISNEPLYATDVNNCVSLLSYIYSVYSGAATSGGGGGSLSATNEQINREVFISYLRNKQMDAALLVGGGQGGVKDETGHPQQQQQTQPFPQQHLTQPECHVIGELINVNNTFSQVNSHVGFQVTNSIKIDDRHELIDGGRKVETSEVGYVDTSLIQTGLSNLQLQNPGVNPVVGGFDSQINSSHILGSHAVQNGGVGFVGYARHNVNSASVLQNIPMYSSNVNNLNQYNRNQLGTVLPAGHPRITGSETNVPYFNQTNISAAPGSYSETNAPYLFNQTSTNVSNFNHFLSNCDQNDTRNVSNFSPTGAGGVPSQIPTANPSCPTFTAPSSFHDGGTSRGKTPGLPGAQLTTNGGSPCERKINAIETRKRSTCRPSLCKIDEETDNGDETENETSEDDEECNGNSDKCDSEKNGKDDVKTEITDADEEESDAYNSSDASDSNSGSDESNEEAIMEDNESFEEDGNEDLRSDDEAICTDNEDGLVMEELGVKDGGQIKTDVADGEGRTDSVDGYNGSIQKRAEKTDSGEFGDDLSGANDGNSFTENTFDSKSKVCNKSMRNEPRKCSNSRTEKVDTENDTSGIFSTNVNSGGLDEIKTDDEVSSDMSEDDEEENVRDDTKSIPTSDVGSEEAIALHEQELEHAELQRTHENIQENSRGSSYQRVFEATNNQKHVHVENNTCTQPVGLQLGTTGAFVKVVPSQQCTSEEDRHNTETPWENEGKPNARLTLEEQQIVDKALSEVNDDAVSKEESSELNTTTEIDSEDSEEDIDEEEVDHVNELMVRSELDKMYAELDEKIQVLNANYLKELFPDERITNDDGGLIRNVNSGRVHTLETHPDQVNCPPNPQNSSQIRPESIQNTNHQHPGYDPNMPTRYGQFGGYPSYNQPNFVNFHSNNFNVHNLLGAYVNDNLVVQRLNDDNGDNQTLNRTEHFNGTDNNQAPRANVNTFPRDLNDNPTHMFNHHHHPENKNFHDPNSSQSQNCQPSAFATYTPSESPANNGLLFNSNSPTTNPLPSDNHSVLKSMSPQQINTNAPQNSTFFGNMVHSPNGAGNRPPLTGRPMDFSHMQNGHLVNSAQYMGNLPFPVNNHAIAAFQALGANGIHPLPYMTNNHQIERQIQTNIPMLPIGRGVTNGPNGHRNYTEEYSPQQLSLDNGCQPQDPQHAHFQTNIPSHQMNSPYQTETRTINSSQGSEDKKAHLSKGDSGKESTESAANKPETSRSRESNGKGKRKSSKSRRKRDSTHSSGECTNESGSQKGRRHKKCSKDSGNSAQNPINTPVDVETFNSGAMPVPNGGTMIENEIITNMNSLKVTDEYCPVERNHTVSNATILNGLPHNLEDIVNLTANMAGMKVNNSIEPRDVQLNLNEQSASVNPVPDLKIKSNKAHKPSSAEPHLSNVLSSCEFQRVWNDIDTKKSQMNVILLDLDTASERINELKQLLNLKNHLLKFLVNNKPLRDEVRNKLDARSVQLKTKMKKLKRELTELKNMEEKINLEKLNLKFKKNRNGGDANRQLILFNHLNRMKHEEEPAVKNGKRVHRKHHRDSERKMIKPHENNEDGFAARNNRGIFNHQKVGSLGNESSLSALVNKYALEGNVRQNELTGGVHGGMYESDEDPMASNGTSLSAGIANLKTQIEATERRLHNLDVITKITMQSDEQIDELNENLSKWTKILSFFEKRVESETLKKEQLENNLVLNLYKIKSMEETFGQERRHKDEVLHDIRDLIDKLKPNKNLVEALKVEKDVTESDKTIKPDSNDSGSNATLSKTSDAKVEATTEHNDKRNTDWTESNARCKSGKETKSNTSQSKDTRTDKSDIECSNISTNKQEVKTKTIEFECQANFSVPCDSLQLPKDLKLNKATNTDNMPSVEAKVAETSSQTDQEIGQKTSDPNGPIETATPCKTVDDIVKVDHQTIKEYNKEVTTLTPLNKQANKKCDVIETLMNGSDKKLDNLLETESSIDTLGSTSMRNYKISNSTEISTDNAISMSDKSGGGVSLAGVAEKRKKKLSLFSSFRSSEKPSEKSSSGKKFKIFNLNKSGDKNKSNDSIRCDKNKSNDSIRFKKPDDQMSNCSNQSANVKAPPQASKDDDKLSNSSLASKLGVIVENSSALRVATEVNVGNGEEKKNNDPAESGNGTTERGASKSVSGQCSNPCRQQTNKPSCCQTCQTNDVSKASDAINNTKDTIGARTAADERKARRDTLKADINKLLELKQEIVEKRITLCPRKCSTEQSEEKKKMFFEYDEAIETVDALIEYKGNLIRDLDELVHMGNHLKPSVDEILHMGNHLNPSGISKNDIQADGTSTMEAKPGTDSRLHSVPNRLPTLDKPANGGGPPNSSEDIVYPNLMSKLTHLSHNELVFVLYKCFARIIDLRTTTVELEKLVQSLDYKLEMKITSLQEMDLKFQRHLQKNQISNEKHLTLLQKDYLNKLHLFYECYCTDHSQSGGDGRSQSTSPTSTARMELNESLLLKEENKFLKSRVKCLEAELRKKSEERGGDGGGGGGYALVPRGGGQVERINQLSNIPSSWNKTITVENNKLVISRKK
uniref:StAR-related lipid transfer protein 9 n=1 Tax=Cacopsylla melanoneura TaxID=428564 RepID=A0A8D9BVU6_9HEMI